MKRIVIAGSIKFYKEIETFISSLEENYKVLDYPQLIDTSNFLGIYPNRYKLFFENISNCDVFVALNFNKNNINGYIGAETFAEITFALLQNMLYNKNIEIYLLNKPDENVACYNEINTWLSLGKIKLWK